MKTLRNVAITLAALVLLTYAAVHLSGNHFEAKYETQEKMGQ